MLTGVKYETASVDGETRSALYSSCEKYRYELNITWDVNKPILCVIGLNPSTATHLKDDPTIRRVKGFARAMDCAGIRMLNAFAYRATDPSELFKVADPVGPRNDIAYLAALSPAGTIAAWGSKIQSRKWQHYYRGHTISEALHWLQCFRKTAAGHPEHPLYLPKDLRPIQFSYNQTIRTHDRADANDRKPQDDRFLSERMKAAQ